MKDKLPEGYEHLQETIRTKTGVIMKPLLGKKMKSICCDEPLIVFIKANSEVEVRCSKCMGYIGHLAPRAYALLYQSLPGSVRETMQELGFDGELTKEALMRVHKRYSELLILSAQECLKQAIREQMDIMPAHVITEGGEVDVELQGEGESEGSNGS